jgi:hypothetical protein
MPSLHHPKSRRPRDFAARVFLSIHQPPIFPDRCIGCGEAKPAMTWTPNVRHLPLKGGADTLDQGAPGIRVPICPACMEHLSDRDNQSFGIGASHLWLPAVFLVATMVFVLAQMQAVAVLTGLGGIIWFAMAMRTAWTHRPLFFDVRAGGDERLIYYFRDSEYAREFDRLNEKSEQPKDSPR